jgi:hypothetical protein
MCLFRIESIVGLTIEKAEMVCNNNQHFFKVIRIDDEYYPVEGRSGDRVLAEIDEGFVTLVNRG